MEMYYDHYRGDTSISFGDHLFLLEHSPHSSGALENRNRWSDFILEKIFLIKSDITRHVHNNIKMQDEVFGVLSVECVCISAHRRKGHHI